MADSWNQQVYNDWVRYLGRHVVCLTFSVQQYDEDGRPVGGERLVGYSGFVVSLAGEWFLLTAGHCLAEIDGEVAKGRIRVLGAGLSADFGPPSGVPGLTLIDYDGAFKRYADRQELGLDFAAVHLRPLYRASLEAGGVVPLDKGAWVRLGDPNFTAFGVYGFPAEFNAERPAERLPFGDSMVTAVQPLLLFVERADAPHRPLPDAPFPWFIGKVDRRMFGVRDIKGMSGGPIFAFGRDAAGRERHGVVAVQSWWDGTETLYGCPMEVVGGILAAELARL